MNHLTREAFQEWIDAVNQVIYGCVHMAGVDDVKDALTKGETLKARLSSDETIP